MCKLSWRERWWCMSSCLHAHVIRIFSTFNMVIINGNVVPICSFLARLFLEQLILMKISLPQIVQNYHEEKDDVCRHVYIHTSSTSFQAWWSLMEMLYHLVIFALIFKTIDSYKNKLTTNCASFMIERVRWCMSSCLHSHVINIFSTFLASVRTIDSHENRLTT